MIGKKEISGNQAFILEIVFILLFSLLPTLIELPYRVNIFVTWEGAYRMYQGQIPFRDFGLPMGYGFWVIPFVFFKLFGPSVFTLVLAQSFINFISLITFRGILKLFNLSPVQILISTLVLCLSFVMVNFWPWYNHTVFVYELIGLYFILRYILLARKIVLLALAGFFMALCFFTKQDGGGLGFVLSSALLIGDAILEKRVKSLLFFILFYAVSMAIFIIPFLQYDFAYWFNYGQSPHFSRINMYDFLTAFFEESLWLKFYILAVFIVCIIRFKNFVSIAENKSLFIFSLFTLGILVQAMIIQVTSFSPPITNYYFHSFAISFLLYNLGTAINFEKVWIASIAILLIFFWRSENYWKYSMRFMNKFLPASFSPPPSSVVSKNTWSVKADSAKGNVVEWGLSNFKAFKRIKLPIETIKGIERIKDLAVVKESSKLSCLNLSNLTPLAFELNYLPPTGKDFPLWHHQGVASFSREIKMLCGKIENSEYDIVLFEVMPVVDNFFPFAVRQCLAENYKLVDSFISPTGYETDFIEVYVRLK